MPEILALVAGTRAFDDSHTNILFAFFDVMDRA